MSWFALCHSDKSAALLKAQYFDIYNINASTYIQPAPTMVSLLSLNEQGGRNTVIPDHTLDKAAIEQFLDGGYNIPAIIHQVCHNMF